jgi:hypothetical protein
MSTLVQTNDARDHIHIPAPRKRTPKQCLAMSNDAFAMVTHETTKIPPEQQSRHPMQKQHCRDGKVCTNAKKIGKNTIDIEVIPTKKQTKLESSRRKCSSTVNATMSRFGRFENLSLHATRIERLGVRRSLRSAATARSLQNLHTKSQCMVMGRQGTCIHLIDLR